MVVSNELKEPIRSHHDIDRDSAKHYKRAVKVRRTFSTAESCSRRLYSSTKGLPSAHPTTVMLLISSPAAWTRLVYWR